MHFRLIAQFMINFLLVMVLIAQRTYVHVCMQLTYLTCGCFSTGCFSTGSLGDFATADRLEFPTPESVLTHTVFFVLDPFLIFTS